MLRGEQRMAMNSISSKHIYRLGKSDRRSESSTAFFLFSGDLVSASYDQRMQARCPERE